MQHIENESLITAIAKWHLAEPVSVTSVDGGFTSHVWKIEINGAQYVAKLAYETQEYFEAGLVAAEIAEHCGLPSGAPLRTPTGELTVMVAHPPGKLHPLALLNFVPGSPLNLGSADSQRIYGRTLGRIHRILTAAGYKPHRPDELFAYLAEPRSEVDEHPWLRPAITAAVAAARKFEAATPVTYGAMYGDALQVRLDEQTGQIGVIDWGATSWGPLLFDLVLALQAARCLDAEAGDGLIEGYLEESPISRGELRGLDEYQALMWARSARYFAWRIAHDVTLGDLSADGNVIAFQQAKRNLERLLDTHFA